MTCILQGETGVRKVGRIVIGLERPRPVGNDVVEQSISTSQCCLAVPENVPPKPDPRFPTMGTIVQDVTVGPLQCHRSTGNLGSEITACPRGKILERNRPSAFSARATKVRKTNPRVQCEAWSYFPVILYECAFI